MNADISKGTIMGTCPVCHCVIRRCYGDKIHKVGYCTGCGLEYGNPTRGTRYGSPKGGLMPSQVRAFVDSAYNGLISSHPHLKVQTMVNVIDKVAIKTTGYGLPDIPRKQLEAWGYEIVAGCIIRKEVVQ